MNPKFKIGARVTVAPLDEEAQEGAMDGVVTKIDTEDYNDGETYYLVELDEPLPEMIANQSYPPYNVDAAEWELSISDKPYKVWPGVYEPAGHPAWEK